MMQELISNWKRALKEHGKQLLWILTIWLAIVFGIDPQGEFAINDDWSYAHNVRSLVVEHKLEFSSWPAMTLIGQTIPAWIWSEVVGFSLTNLRWLTVLIAFGSLIVFYFLTAGSTTNRNALLGALILIANPYFLTLSLTFMTEIYYLFYVLGMLYFTQRFFNTNRTWDFGGLIVFFAFAVLTRQTALMYAPLFGSILLLRMKWSPRVWFLAVLPSILGVGLLIIYKWVRLNTGSGMGTFSSVGALIRGVGNYSLEHYFSRFGLIVLYLGLTGIPILILRFKHLVASFRRHYILSLAVALLVGSSMILARQTFPIGNVLEGIGIGPHLLKDAVFGLHHGQTVTLVWNVLYVLAFASGLLLFTGIITGTFEALMQWRSTDKIELFVITLIFAELSYLILNPIFFDRYSLILSIMVLLLLMRKAEFHRSASFAIPMFALVLPLLSLYDFMNWQRMRLEATRFLVNERSVSHDQIDGGFEFNAWHEVAPIGEVSYELTKKSWWFVKDDQFIIASIDTLPNYRKIRMFPIEKRCLSPLKAIYVLERTE